MRFLFQNAFAHHLDIVDFTSQRIRDFCASLELLDPYVTNSEKTGISMKRPDPNQPAIVRIRLKDRDKELENPRNRYLVSAVMFDMLLRVRKSGEVQLPQPLF